MVLLFVFVLFKFFLHPKTKQSSTVGTLHKPYTFCHTLSHSIIMIFYSDCLNTLNYHRHLISLWLPSICHNDNGCFTLYWRLLTVDFHLCTIPMGSILKDRRILSLWTRNPLLSRKPFRILIPIPRCSSHAFHTYLHTYISFI